MILLWVQETSHYKKGRSIRIRIETKGARMNILLGQKDKKGRSIRIRIETCRDVLDNYTTLEDKKGRSIRIRIETI